MSEVQLRKPRGRGTSVVDLDRERERRLFYRYRRFGDATARAQLIERFLPLAHHLACRYRRGNDPVDDLVQVASVGLVKAVDRFDPSRGTAFSSYAVPTIVGELKRYFRDAGWALRVPRAMQERALLVNAAVARLSRQLGRSPAPREIAEATGLTPEEVAEAIETAVAARPTSLDGGREGDDQAGTAPGDPLGREDDGYALVEDRDAVARGLSAMSEQQQTVIRLRFGEELTQSQIAARVGISQMQVSRVLRRTIDGVRASAEAPPPNLAPSAPAAAARVLV